MSDQWWPWAVRAIWLTLPFTVGEVIGDAVADSSRPVQLTATIGAWLLWGLGLALTAVPHTTTLTPLRLIGPGAFVVAAVAAVDAGVSAMAVAALALSAAASVAILSPAIGAWFINGSSYGAERRVPLRPPATLLFGPIPIAGAVVVATAISLPLLVAAKGWVAAAVVAVIGGPMSLAAARALHRLTARWLVFVPAGMVVHDPLAVPDPVLFKRTAVHTFGPALADTTAVDLSMGATGLLLELRLTEPAEIAHRAGPGQEPEAHELQAILVAPARPGVVLEEAKARRITVA